MAVEQSIVDRPVEVPSEWSRQAAERGWPAGLIERICNLRVDRGQVEFWLTHDPPTIEQIKRLLDDRERVMFSTIKVREATWQDDAAVSDLYAASPEDIGDWEVTVERSPYPFAQFRLQEHVNIQVVEDHGVMLAIAVHSVRNTIANGKRMTAHIATAWRTRRECRGRGYSNLLRAFGGPATAWFGALNYWYFRSGNIGAFNWVKALAPNMLGDVSADDGKLPGLPVAIHHFAARPFDGDPIGIRLGRRGDMRRCVALINRTHRGLDLFRPYSEEFLHVRLDDPYWDPKPPFWTAVYGWPDYHVLEEDGRIVACAGLWDRGKHIREVWQHRTNGERNVVECTALMDWGYAPGREDAMERLLWHLMGRTHTLGRDSMMAPIEQLPVLLDRMAVYDPQPEMRAMEVDNGPDDLGLNLNVTIKRPYTDLAYW